MTQGDRCLLRWVGELSGYPAQVDRLSFALFDESECRSSTSIRHCTLNNDGSPVQVCLTAGASGWRTRIVGEPGAHVENPEQRFCAGQTALTNVLRLTDSDALARVCEVTLGAMLPARTTHSDMGAGFFWLAAGLDRGAAIYVNTRWDSHESRWSDAARWLRSLLLDDAAASALIRVLTPRAELASVGVEGTSPVDARAKLYWRFRGPGRLCALGIPLLSDWAFETFLVHLAADTPVPLSGIVLSTGFALRTGELTDVKIDLCAHCLPKPASVWTSLITALTEEFQLAAPNIADALLGRVCEMAFVGLGLNVEGEARLNLYLKAPAGTQSWRAHPKTH